jgi:hypothetical protein
VRHITHIGDESAHRLSGALAEIEFARSDTMASNGPLSTVNAAGLVWDFTSEMRRKTHAHLPHSVVNL